MRQNFSFLRNLNVKRMGVTLSTLLVTLLATTMVSCEPNECPNVTPRGEEEGNTNTANGVEIVLEIEDEHGNMRTVSGDSNYSFTEHGKGGTIQVVGTGFKSTKGEFNAVNVPLTFYAAENVVFQGWSWRYEEDPKGTHRKVHESTLNDFIPTPAIQVESGVQKLDIKKEDTSFTCYYHPERSNKVYVKVKYAKTSDFKEKRASLYFAPIFTNIHMQDFKDFIGEVDPVNPDYENPTYKDYNLYGWWVASDIDSAITEGDFLSKFGVDLYIERGDLNPLVIAGEKLKVDMTISGSIIPICRFIFDFNQYPHNKFYIFRKMYEDKRTLSENHVVSFYIKPEHHEGHYEEWAERGASSPYGGDPRVDTSGNAYRELLNAVEFDLRKYSRSSFGEEWYAKGQLVKFDNWLMAERNGWKITSAKVAPILLDDTIYYFDVRF